MGPNTGGMGCISPSPFMNDVLREKIMKKVVQPTIDGLNKWMFPIMVLCTLALWSRMITQSFRI